MPQRATTFSSLLPSLWSSSSIPVIEPGNVNAVTFVGNDVWALVDSRLQKWHMAPEGWEEMILDEDMAETIRSATRKEFKGVPVDDSAMDLELLDMASQRERSVAFCTFPAQWTDCLYTLVIRLLCSYPMLGWMRRMRWT
jgi:hypothetical protein